MIQKKISSKCGHECDSQVEVLHLDNGQSVFHVAVSSETGKFEHRVTVGAENGEDALKNKSAEEIKLELQKHLDEVRQHAADILGARNRVKNVAEGLE